MITKKACRGRPKKVEVQPLLEGEEELLVQVKPRNKGTVMSLLNKKKLSKYELDAVFMEDFDEDL